MHSASALADFGDSALAACFAQFPRVCSGCRRTHADFLSYLEATKTVGAPMLDPDDEEDDAIGLLSFANCSCGTTLAIRYEDVSRHASFNAAVRRDLESSGQSETQLLTAFVEAIHARARTTVVPSFTPSVPDERVLEVGAAMVAILERGSVLVPPFPAVAFKVAELARAPDSSPEEIARVISSDATLVAELLQLVNAPIYARGQPVTSLTMAVKRLGMKEVARLAIAAGVGGATARPGVLAPVRLHLWHRSATTATVSRALGITRRLNPDECFLGGLLYPLGSIVGTLSLEVFLAEHPSFPAQPLAFWVRVLEVFRAELGALTATRWKLPKSLAEVIGLHAGVPGEAPALNEVVSAATNVTRLAGEREVVTEADLEALPVLTKGEATHLARVLPQLAESIAAFEESTAPRSLASKVLPADVPSDGAAPANAVFLVNGRRREERFKIVSRGARSLIVEGPAPLPENVLTSLELATQPPVSLCAVTTSCVPVKGGQRLVLAPFAVSVEASRRLAELTAP